VAFVNEYIPELDYEKYNLKEVCGRLNLSHRGRMFSQSWTIDRERNIFLINTWSHREADCEGAAFYWKGAWIPFEVIVKKSEDNPEYDSCWSLYHIRKFNIPAWLESEGDAILNGLCEAYSAYAGGGVFGKNRTHRSATVEFVEG